jgi:hypothetical protein
MEQRRQTLNWRYFFEMLIASPILQLRTSDTQMNQHREVTQED